MLGDKVKPSAREFMQAEAWWKSLDAYVQLKIIWREYQKCKKH